MTYVESLSQLRAAAKAAANFVTGELARRASEEGIDLRQAKVTPAHLAEVIRLVQAGEVSSTGAKAILAHAWKSGEPVAAIVEREGLKQVSDTGALETLVAQIVAENPKQAAELKAGFASGQTKLLGFFVGQVMKRSGGKANPQLLQGIIRKKVESL
jgi:aspartyl-tRNA(Asn)/glutamyl-tRNA(Gln) amidotransferase subunit B